jgi:phosphopantothenoylcysteine synthetase/decarboxylase
MFGLLGPNGAGKSTLINILAGVVNKTAGKASIWGRDIDERPRDARAALGVVPQEIVADVFFTPREALDHKRKKTDGDWNPVLGRTSDILGDLAKHTVRPRLTIGFAAETDDVIAHARGKLAKKGCDLIVANDVSGDVMGGERNQVHLVSAGGVETLPEGPKDAVARMLAERIAGLLNG